MLKVNYAKISEIVKLNRFKARNNDNYTRFASLPQSIMNSKAECTGRVNIHKPLIGN